jgi:hypothetical protein
MDTILAEAFGRNDSFAMALKEAFEHFINQRQNKCVTHHHKCPCIHMTSSACVQGRTRSQSARDAPGS